METTIREQRTKTALEPKRFIFKVIVYLMISLL